MYELSKEFRFDAAHTLARDVDQHEKDGSRRIHGHSYRAEITLRGLPDAKTGMLIDVYEFQKAFEEVRDSLEHHFLDDIQDLGPATMENLCAWIWKRLAPKLPLLSRVTIYRDSGQEKCVFYGPNAT
jgi:6-pyruvoyltetrahydropterin/6-carboxytetrahydropterin synthase